MKEKISWWTVGKPHNEIFFYGSLEVVFLGGFFEFNEFQAKWDAVI